MVDTEPAAPMTVVVLCAAWCDTCREFRAAFERLAAEWPAARFVWLDIEDDAEVVGDIEVESFPTLVVYRDGRPVHFGVSLPHHGVVHRLISAFSGERPGQIACAPAVETLPGRIGFRQP